MLNRQLKQVHNPSYKSVVAAKLLSPAPRAMPAPGPATVLSPRHVSSLHSPARAATGSLQPTLQPELPVHPPAHHHNIEDDIESVLFSEAEIKSRVQQIGRQLAKEYAGRAPLVLGVLTGAFQFTGDLVRCMEPVPRGTTINFVRASSYGSGTQSSGQVSLKVDIDPATVKGRHVILVEDIVDTGLTLTKLRAYLYEVCGAASVKIVTLLDKKERRKVPLEPDVTGFDCPNEFVVGYGLDFDEEYRTLPYIGILKAECGIKH